MKTYIDNGTTIEFEGKTIPKEISNRFYSEFLAEQYSGEATLVLKTVDKESILSQIQSEKERRVEILLPAKDRDFILMQIIELLLKRINQVVFTTEERAIFETFNKKWSVVNRIRKFVEYLENELSKMNQEQLNRFSVNNQPWPEP